MMKKIYEEPKIETLHLEIEDSICTSAVEPSINYEPLSGGGVNATVSYW